VADQCLDELTLEELDTLTLELLDVLPLGCDPEGPEAGEYDYYSGDALALGLGNN